MITFEEVSRSVFGVLRLAVFDTRGLDFLDRTPAGAMRSFWCAVLLLPPFAVVKLLDIWPVLGEVPFARLVVVEVSAYVIGWTVFPVLMAEGVRWIDREEKYWQFLSAYNWANVVYLGVLLPVAILAGMFVLPAPLADGLSLAVTAAILVFQWFVLKTSLEIGGGLAVGLVVADNAVSILNAQVASALVQPS
jgi:hypothetical protein